NNIQSQADGVVIQDPLSVSIVFAVDSRHQIVGRIQNGEPAIEEVAVHLGQLQRRVVAQGGGTVGELVERVPAGREERMRGRQLDQLGLGEHLFQLAFER